MLLPMIPVLFTTGGSSRDIGHPRFHVPLLDSRYRSNIQSVSTFFLRAFANTIETTSSLPLSCTKFHTLHLSSYVSHPASRNPRLTSPPIELTFPALSNPTIKIRTSFSFPHDASELNDEYRRDRERPMVTVLCGRSLDGTDKV
jgi:hypothetical protein